MNKKPLMAAFVAACVSAAMQPSGAAALAEPLARPAQIVGNPAKSFLTAIAEAGRRLVAVGERGIIVLSDDGGKTWRQAKVPVSVTLTAVQFVTPTRGWAVGHYGIVLHSADGGATWTRQLDGIETAQIMLKSAQVGQGGSPYRAEAERLVADGPDKPFLALHFSDENNGIVVGAYNLAMRTQDGGKTWAPFSARLDNPNASHLYTVRAAGNDIYIAGEQGLLLRSLDGGQRFDRIETGYGGSYFAMALSGSDVVVAGLGGNAYRSADKGANWQKMDVPVPVSITAIGARGTQYLMTNQAGMLLAGTAGAARVLPVKTNPLPPLNDVLTQPDGSIVAVGISGAVRLPAPATPALVSVK